MKAFDGQKAIQYFESVFQYSVEGIIIVDASGTILQSNPAFEKLLGYNKEQLTGTSFIKLAHKGEKVQKLTSPTRLHHFNRSSNFPLELHLIDKQGISIPVRLRSILIKDAAGNVSEAIGIVEDLRQESGGKGLEQKIWETQETLQNVLANSGDATFLANTNGVITTVNEALLKMLGYEHDEVVGKHLTEFSPFEGTYNLTTGEELALGEDYINYQLEKANELFEKGKVTNYNLYLTRKDRLIIPIEATIAVLKDLHGEQRGSIAICRDITERTKAEKKIKKTKDFLENIFRTSTDGIVVSNNQGILTMVNDAVARMTGYSIDELIGKHSFELGLLEEEYAEKGKEFVAKLHEEGTVTGFENTWLKKDGSTVEIELNASLLKDKEGNLEGAIACVRDISERKKAEEVLKQSEERYHNLIEFANVGIVVSENSEITHFNKKAEEIYGYCKDEIIGKSPSILTLEKARQRHREHFNKLLASEKAEKTVFEEEGVRKDGTVFPVEISFALIQPSSKTMIAAVNDITERKEMEKKLLQSEKLTSLGELAGGVAHDFNNVLAAILGRAQLLRMYIEPPTGKQERRKMIYELKKGMKVIERAALDGAETVRRIQEFSRRRDDDSYFSAVNVNEIISHALEFTKVRWKNEAEAKGIFISIEKAFSPLPPIAGSASELREVFTNLINNALDAMPHGGMLRISTAVKNEQVVATVADSGIGIPLPIRDKIFDPFFTTKGPQSTGLGMSVSYGIINRHQGTINVDSCEGRGTTFAIELPLSVQKLMKEKATPVYSDQKKGRILVIEDEGDVRELLSDILMSEGHMVESAAEGTEGIEKFRVDHYDMVFTDLGMPGLSGWQVAQEIKQIRHDTPVALITGWNVAEKECQSKHDQVDLIINKPFRVDQVLQAVQDLMDKNHFNV